MEKNEVDERKKHYQIPLIEVRISNFDLMKAYPWSDMPGTGGYAWPQKLPHAKEADVNEEEEKVDECEFGKLW